MRMALDLRVPPRGGFDIEMSRFVPCMGTRLQHFPLVNMCKLPGSESRLAKGPTTPFSGDLGFFELPCFMLSPSYPFN